VKEQPKWAKNDRENDERGHPAPPRSTRSKYAIETPKQQVLLIAVSYLGALAGDCPLALRLRDASFLEPVVDRSADLFALEDTVSLLYSLKSVCLLVIDPKRIAFAWRH
jgi:hypothetical protein